MKQDSRFARPDALDETISRGWWVLAEADTWGWVCRFSGGVTKRANSVLPLRAPAGPAAAIVVAGEFYAVRGLPAVFQVSPDSLPADLDTAYRNLFSSVPGKRKVAMVSATRFRRKPASGSA